MDDCPNPFGLTSMLVRSFGRGFVFEWSGLLADIPETYQLCDGTNGTPDLRERFTVGAGNVYAIDETGGNLAHTHAFTSALHDHTFDFTAGGSVGAGGAQITSAEVAIGTTDGTSDLPIYYSLAYIMQTG